MGLIRKSLFLGTGGLVSPNSKKQRVQKQQLAALQGATPKEIRRAGGRNDIDGFLGLPPASVRTASQPARRFSPCAACGTPVRWVSGRFWDERNGEHTCAGSSVVQPGQPPSGADPGLAGRSPADQDSGTSIRLSCGHAEFITDPGIVKWLSVDGDLSYRCRTCDADQPIVAIGEDASLEPASLGDGPSRPTSRQLIDELERLAGLHVSGALTDAEFLAAKARLLGL